MGKLFPSVSGFSLFGDLHANNSRFAVACEEGGSEAVIFHLNQDSVTGGRFGGLELEEDSIRDAISILKIPAGISIGDTRQLSEQEWESIMALGFSFVNMYAHHMPSFLWRDQRIEKTVSIGPGYILEQVKGLAEFEQVSAVVAALTPNQGVGMPLTLLDITTLKLISRLSIKPIFIPTQRKIQLQDLALLRDLGCKGLIITSTVYGDNDQSCREHVSQYRDEIARLTQTNTPQTFTN